MKKKKRYVQACDLSAYKKKDSIGKKVSPLHKGVSRKSLSEVYNKFYRDQVAALYRAVID